MTEPSPSPLFGERLRRFRRAAGLTQSELAERAGLSTRGISDLERGARRAPYRDTVRQLAEALGLSASETAVLQAAIPRARGAAPNGDMGRGGEPPGATHTATSGPVRPLASTMLPAPLTSFVGREREAAEAAHLLRRPGLRLLTLTGPGGVGKTRLALRVAEELAGDFADGIAFVALSPIVDPRLVLAAIARTVGVSEVGGQALPETLVAALRDRRLLLVIDNFEHVADAAADVATLLQACPQVSALVTSRASLRIRGEQSFPVPTLDVPDASGHSRGHGPAMEAVAQYPAVRLLIERAQAARPDFAPTPATIATLAAICQRLDGLPLAIELVAPRLALIAPEVLRRRLEQRLPLSTGGARDLPERQRTLRATLAWSEYLLGQPERALFRRLAVFAEGCAPDAVEAVCATPAGAPRLDMDTLEGLNALAEHSLLRLDGADDGGARGPGGSAAEARVDLLHIVREYALERLEASGEAEALRRAHAAYYLALAEEANTRLRGPDQALWLDRLEREHDNLRAALGWARDRGEWTLALRLAGALSLFWATRGHFTEGRRWLDGLLAADPAGPALARGDAAADGGASDGVDALGVVRARVIFGAGALAFWQGDQERARSLLERCAALTDASDLAFAADALNLLGVIAHRVGDREPATAAYERSLALAWQQNDPLLIARPLANLGQLAYDRGELRRAEELSRESLALFRQAGDLHAVAIELGNLANAARRRGDLAQATDLLHESIELCQRLGDPRLVATTLEDLAAVASAGDRGERAARLLGAATALRETIGSPLAPPERDDTERALAPARTALGEAAWAVAFAAGHALPAAEAIDEALRIRS